MLQIWILLLVTVVAGQNSSSQTPHQQPQPPQKVDPRNHYYLPDGTQAFSGNATSNDTSSSLPSKLRFARRDVAAAAAASAPTSSTGALLCSKNSPCIDGSCCGPNNICGFGPASCGTGCQNNCQATAPCGVNSDGGKVSCGMNVCCSNSGWCGVTEDYCAVGKYGCQQGFGSCSVASPPSCDAGAMSASKRTVGYYQGANGLAAASLCGRVKPSDIDTSKYTHLYWGFAELDPTTYNVVPAGPSDTSLYNEFTSLQSPGKLETWISIGGFDFTTANPKAFSNMVSTASNRQSFINSLVNLMTQYNFQGVDIDWEYPVDKNRGGSPQDMVNLVQLLADMRASFGQKFGISVTLAPDLWYLQHYDAKGLLANANWLGFMSYDLHGTWDANDPIGKKVLGMTNINDISRDLIPLWFDLSPQDLSRVNFGLALYGRGYTLADPSCNRADGSCQWTAGSNPGECTATAGVLSSAEIRQIIKSKGLTPVAMQDGTGTNTMMKQITWDDQWVGYDDADTIAEKIAYASGRCFGGTMAWSVDLAVDKSSGETSKNHGPVFNYGVIGDSWGSGVAWNNDVLYDKNAGKCLRTFESHGPQLEADTSWLNGYTGRMIDAACSGSQLVDLARGQMQMSQVGAGNPDVVVMTSGGNNCNFGNIVQACIYHPQAQHDYGKEYPDAGSDCAKLLAGTRNYITATDGDHYLQKDLTITIEELLNDPSVRSNPDFKLYVTGYAQFFGNDAACDTQSFTVAPKLQRSAIQHLNSDIRNDFNTLVTTLNNLYKSVVQGFGDKVRYIDIDSQFAGHRFCDTNTGNSYSTDTYSPDCYLWNVNWPTQLPSGKPKPPGDDTSGGNDGIPDDISIDQYLAIYPDDDEITAWSGSGENDPKWGWQLRPFHPRYTGYTAIKNAIIAQMKADGFPKPPAVQGGNPTSSQGPAPTSTGSAPPKVTCSIDCGSEIPGHHPPVCICHCSDGKTWNLNLPGAPTCPADN